MATQPNTSKPTGLDLLTKSSTQDPRSNLIVNLNHKDLTDLNKLLLWKCRKYLGISLAYNQINFNPNLCSQLTFVKYLNLSHNALTCLPQNFGDLINLAVFEATNNQISKLPISLSECRSLRFMDLRQNPFVTSWTALGAEKPLTFDPVEFARHIVPFMQAVRRWRQNLIYARAEEMLEFLVISPTFDPTANDGNYYDIVIRDYSHCPLSNMHKTCPLKLELFLDSLQNASPKCPLFLQMAFYVWTVVIRPLFGWLRKGLYYFLLLVFLASALSKTNWIGEFMAWTPLGFVLQSCIAWLQEVIPLEQPLFGIASDDIFF